MTCVVSLLATPCLSLPLSLSFSTEVCLFFTPLFISQCLSVLPSACLIACLFCHLPVWFVPFSPHHSLLSVCLFCHLFVSLLICSAIYLSGLPLPFFQCHFFCFVPPLLLMSAIFTVFPTHFSCLFVSVLTRFVSLLPLSLRFASAPLYLYF